MTYIDPETYAVSPLAAALYGSLVPGMEDESDPTAEDLSELFEFCTAFARPVDIIYEIAQNRWQDVLDPVETPAEALPWLAQFVGVIAEPSWLTSELRSAIERPAGFARGTVGAIREAIERTSSVEDPAVIFVERFGGNAYHLFIRTLDSETPSEDATRAAILAEKPGGIILNYEASDSQTFFQLDTDHADFAAVLTDYEDFAGLLADA